MSEHAIVEDGPSRGKGTSLARDQLIRVVDRVLDGAPPVTATNTDLRFHCRDLASVLEELLVWIENDDASALGEVRDYIRAKFKTSRVREQQVLECDGFKRETIHRALVAANWNQTEAAKTLGVTQSAVWQYIDRWWPERIHPRKKITNEELLSTLERNGWDVRMTSKETGLTRGAVRLRVLRNWPRGSRRHFHGE